MKTFVLSKKTLLAFGCRFAYHHQAFYPIVGLPLPKDAIKARINRNHLDINGLLLYYTPRKMDCPFSAEYSLKRRILKPMKVSVFRMAHFNAAHRLHNPAWSAEKNTEVFGLCNNEYYHGHNYELEVRLTGEIDPDTGYVYDLGKLADLVSTHVEKKFDHKNLNLQVEEFKNILPSAENMAVVIYNILRKHIDERYDLGIKLWETPRNYVQYPA